ncbi:glycosyltransferase [Bacteroides sp. 224]|uniref:glycosyltransferase n=1 Tax=Bacteroides sp. 224 TaxID=2302936 RepID=UPI0013D294D5|nr:glycosyltransferase [Bacteroides sp. 224]NDV64198.1 glycosyltransferase family 2 protein [Bacteroides sp. 224]
MKKMSGISVIMPTYNQASFIRRAILSLFNQTYEKWELIIINDGCTDDTKLYIKDYLLDSRIKYVENEKNEGLGFSVNRALNIAQYEYIAYLPSDDYFFKDHLQAMMDKLKKYDNIILVYSGIMYQSLDTMSGFLQPKESYYIRKGYCLQMIQVLHRKTNDRWLERSEWVTEDLFAMFWEKLSTKGSFLPTKQITSFWTDHPNQRHKIISEDQGGGLNYYRVYYNVENPIKMRISSEKFIDEKKLYENYRKKQVNDVERRSLKILLVGELAYNPERMYALEEAGHKLYGLWIQRPNYSFNTVGPLPFGNVTNIPFDKWEEKIEEIKPDIIYGLLNYTAVPLAYMVLRKFRNIPFVWHFKEGPSMCLKSGLWKELLYLYTYSDGKIFINEIAKRWYEQFIPAGQGISFILDGDLPKKEIFAGKQSVKLSEIDGEVHTVIAGRIIGVDLRVWTFFIERGIHIHVYNENYLSARQVTFNQMKEAAPEHFHLHPHCPPDAWLQEFSKYDAGWLHSLSSSNKGDIAQASWDDLNIPARMSTYAVAGLPVILRDNSGHIVSTQEKVRDMNVGLFYNDYEDLGNQLLNKKKNEDLGCNMWKNRELFHFDYYVPQLISFFREVIKNKK